MYVEEQNQAVKSVLAESNLIILSQLKLKGATVGPRCPGLCIHGFNQAWKENTKHGILRMQKLQIRRADFSYPQVP